jgi:hypothetical protein
LRKSAIYAVLAGCALGVVWMIVGPRVADPRAATAVAEPPPRAAAPMSYAPLQWAEGQWRKHRIGERDGRATVTTLAVVKQDSSGTWIEQQHTGLDGRTQVVKVLYATQPATPEEAYEAARAIAIRFEDGTTFSASFPAGDADDEKKAEFTATIVSMAGLSGALRDPTQDVGIASGRFAACKRMTAPVARGPGGKRIAGWYHPSVPLGGMVRGESPDGESTLELVDFGVAGATSHF